MTKNRDCGGGRKLGSKDAEKRTRSKATAAKLQSNSEKRAATESVSRVVEREKERQPTFSFSKVLGAVLLSRLSLLWFSGYNISTEIL